MEEWNDGRKSYNPGKMEIFYLGIKKKAHHWQASFQIFWIEELFDDDAFCENFAIGGFDLSEV